MAARRERAAEVLSSGRIASQRQALDRSEIWFQIRNMSHFRFCECAFESSFQSPVPQRLRHGFTRRGRIAFASKILRDAFWKQGRHD